MFPAYPVARSVAARGSCGRRAAVQPSVKFSASACPLPQWRHEAVLGVYQGSTAETVWTEAPRHRARRRGAERYAPLFPDRCAPLGEWPGERDVELSVGLGNLS